jgi:hypothetical protein
MFRSIRTAILAAAALVASALLPAEIGVFAQLGLDGSAQARNSQTKSTISGGNNVNNVKAPRG